jgi:hypothetical protein
MIQVEFINDVRLSSFVSNEYIIGDDIFSHA